LPERYAAELFIERAAAAGVQLERATAIDEICRRLDCLPLAIELAAAHTRMLLPEVMLARFERRLPMLTRGARDLPERQRTLRATIEWSYALLEPQEQEAFARLAVFAGGCTPDAAERICDARLETVESLMDKSLVRSSGEGVMMLETILEYARERLDASGEAGALTRPLGEWLYERAQAFTSERGRRQVVPLSTLESELENIRAALHAALDARDPLALQLAVALASFWRLSGRHVEGLRWTVEALEEAGEVDPPLRADGLHAAAMLATLATDSERAMAFGEEALALHRATGNKERMGDVLPWLANAHIAFGDVDRARMLHEESIELQDQLGRAAELASALRLAAEDELAMGNPVRATELFHRALALARSAGLDLEAVMILHGLGDVCLVAGDPAGASAFYVEALRSSVDEIPVAYCLAGLAAAAALQQRIDHAGRIWGAVQSHQASVGERVLHPYAVGRYEAAFRQIDGAPFADAVTAGRSLTLDEATAHAIETFGSF